jgi:hypothetical protein
MRRLLIGLALLTLTPPTVAEDTGPKRLFESPPPDARTSAPSPAAWEGAQQVHLERPLPENCQARLQAEWLRIRCRTRETRIPANGAVLSGDTDGVDFLLSRAEGGIADVVMPLRRGDRRTVQLLRSNGGSEGVIGQELMLLVSVDWLDRGAGPTVVASPLPYAGPFRGLHAADKEETEKALGQKLRWHAPYVLKVDPGSPADKAGLIPGDKIVSSFTGEDNFSSEDMFNELVFWEADKIRLAVMRGRQASITPFWLPAGPQPPK